MSSVQYLRALINERLTAAAEEIFTEFEKTIVQYEEEIDRQRRLLDVTWNPQLTLQTTDLPQQHVYEVNVLCEQQLCNQERNSSLDQDNPEPALIKEEQEELCTSLHQKDPEPPQIKEEQEEVCTSLEGEQLVLIEEIHRHHRLLDSIWNPKVILHRIDFPQQHVCKEKKGFNDQQLCNQKRNFCLDTEPSQIKEEQEALCTSLDQKDPEPPQINEKKEELCTSLDQEDPEPPQINEEQQELCISQQGEQIVLTQATDTFLLTTADEDSDHSDLDHSGLEPFSDWSDQLLSCNSLVAESPHQEGSKHVDSGSTRNAALKPKMSHNTNSSHSSNVDDSSLSESHCDTDTGRKSVKCDVCGSNFKKQYSCERCRENCGQNGTLTIHKRTQTGEKFSCKTCGKRFSRISSLNVHMRIHTGEKPHSCETCGKSFRKKSTLTVHKRIHTGEKPYSCKTCGKSFSQHHGLLSHMRIHTGQKPYSCDRCGKSYIQRNNLTVHMRTHTGEKPYFCETCGKRFSQRNNMTIHMRTHTGEKPYFCETCGKSFSQRSNLTIHVRRHTNEKPYSCKTCGKCFIQHSQLTVHMRTHTGERPYLFKARGKSFRKSSSLTVRLRTRKRKKL